MDKQISPIQVQKRSRAKKVVLWTSISLIVLLFIACIGISSYVGWSLTHPERKPINQYPNDFGLTYEPVEFSSRDGEVVLKGWFLPSEGYADMTIIMAHGYRGNRLEEGVPALALARSFVTANYNVFMFDFRNSGESEGHMTSVGQFEKEDLLGAIDYVVREYNTKVGIVGFSMGGATAILAAAEDSRVLGVVADSPFNNLRNYLKSNLSHWSDLPEFPFTPLIMTIIPPLTGMNPDEVDPLTAIEQVYPRPILFIHGDGDDAIPVSNSEEMVAKYPDTFSLWKTSQAGHVKSYELYPQQYEDRVLQFFQSLK